MQKNNLKMLKKPIILSIFSFWTFSVFFTLLILIIKYSFNNQQYINSQIIGLLLIFGLIFSVFITMTVWTNQTFKSRALVFVEEYTKEIEAEKEKNIYLSRLSSLGKMAAGIAHEINNPLTVIVGKTKSIEREIQELTPDRIKIQISAEKIKGNSYRISKIVDTLKFITRDSSSEDMKKESFINIV